MSTVHYTRDCHRTCRLRELYCGLDEQLEANLGQSEHAEQDERSPLQWHQCMSSIVHFGVPTTPTWLERHGVRVGPEKKS